MAVVSGGSQAGSVFSVMDKVKGRKSLRWGLGAASGTPVDLEPGWGQWGSWMGVVPPVCLRGLPDSVLVALPNSLTRCDSLVYWAESGSRAGTEPCCVPLHLPPRPCPATLL